VKRMLMNSCLHMETTPNTKESHRLKIKNLTQITKNRKQNYTVLNQKNLTWINIC